MASRQVRQQLIEDYKDALQRSPSWIRSIFKLFLTFPDRVVLNRPFLYFILGTGTPPYKMGRMTADYGTSKVEGQTCGNCIHAYQNAVNNKYICSQIQGEIAPPMWCRLWHGGEAQSEIAGSGKRVRCSDGCEANMLSGQTKEEACCDDCGVDCPDDDTYTGQTAETNTVKTPVRYGRMLSRGWSNVRAEDAREFQNMDLD